MAYQVIDGVKFYILSTDSTNIASDLYVAYDNTNFLYYGKADANGFNYDKTTGYLKAAGKSGWVINRYTWYNSNDGRAWLYEIESNPDDSSTFTIEIKQVSDDLSWGEVSFYAGNGQYLARGTSNNLVYSDSSETFIISTQSSSTPLFKKVTTLYHTVTYKIDGVIWATQTVNETVDGVVPAGQIDFTPAIPPSKQGYSFDGWYLTGYNSTLTPGHKYENSIAGSPTKGYYKSTLNGYYVSNQTELPKFSVQINVPAYSQDTDFNSSYSSATMTRNVDGQSHYGGLSSTTAASQKWSFSALSISSSATSLELVFSSSIGTNLANITKDNQQNCKLVISVKKSNGEWLLNLNSSDYITSIKSNTFKLNIPIKTLTETWGGSGSEIHIRYVYSIMPYLMYYSYDGKTGYTSKHQSRIDIPNEQNPIFDTGPTFTILPQQSSSPPIENATFDGWSYKPLSGVADIKVGQPVTVIPKFSDISNGTYILYIYEAWKTNTYGPYYFALYKPTYTNVTSLYNFSNLTTAYSDMPSGEKKLASMSLEYEGNLAYVWKISGIDLNAEYVWLQIAFSFNPEDAFLYKLTKPSNNPPSDPAETLLKDRLSYQLEGTASDYVIDSSTTLQALYVRIPIAIFENTQDSIIYEDGTSTGFVGQLSNVKLLNLQYVYQYEFRLFYYDYKGNYLNTYSSFTKKLASSLVLDFTLLNQISKNPPNDTHTKFVGWSINAGSSTADYEAGKATSNAEYKDDWTKYYENSSGFSGDSFYNWTYPCVYEAWKEQILWVAQIQFYDDKGNALTDAKGQLSTDKEYQYRFSEDVSNKSQLPTSYDVPVRPNLKKDFYYFKGWGNDQANKDDVDIEPSDTTYNIKLDAQLQADLAPQTITVHMYPKFDPFKWKANLILYKNNTNVSVDSDYTWGSTNSPINIATYEYGKTNTSNRGVWSNFNITNKTLNFTHNFDIPSPTDKNDKYVFDKWIEKIGNTSQKQPNSENQLIFTFNSDNWPADNTTSKGIANVTIKLYAQWTEGGYVYIYFDNKWQKAIPYIFDGKEWKATQPYIFNGTEWKATTS